MNNRKFLPALALLTCAASECHAQLQDALNPAGPQARHIERLWWLYLAVAIVVYILVMLFVVLVANRSRRRTPSSADPAPTEESPVLVPDPARERRLVVAVSTSVFVTVVLLFVLLIGDFVSGRAIHGMTNALDSITIKVTGHQWWWEVQYDDPTPSNIVITANEIHIPVGRPVEIRLNSVDVIHSFWVPNLHGKKDMIPGHQTSLWLKAEREGTFFGQCAEFCGFQHAQMRLVVVAESPAKFESWLDSQRQPATQPTAPRQKRGQEVFLRGTCALCHSIGGTDARGRVGPDLTHLASRAKIAAGALDNNTGHLAGWILDPQKIKPGVRMPPNPLDPNDLHALLDYLGTLK